MTTSNLFELHAIAQGNVQGVGFRATVREHALKLGLKGSVCNLPDGSVEIYAQGTREQLKTLLESLQRDMGSRYLKSISTDFYAPTNNYEHFSIIYHKT